ncbi:MAG: hypothetical protein MR598_08415 [Erysipelotrichaceae bacterium]|nr:hypothetical protein [Erysipelotrichaceae bacterium]
MEFETDKIHDISDRKLNNRNDKFFRANRFEYEFDIKKDGTLEHVKM